MAEKLHTRSVEILLRAKLWGHLILILASLSCVPQEKSLRENDCGASCDVHVAKACQRGTLLQCESSGLPVCTADSKDSYCAPFRMGQGSSDFSFLVGSALEVSGIWTDLYVPLGGSDTSSELSVFVDASSEALCDARTPSLATQDLSISCDVPEATEKITVRVASEFEVGVSLVLRTNCCREVSVR